MALSIMTNEQLAVMIQSGKPELMSELWFQVEKFTYQQASLFFSKYKIRCEQLGLTIEDLYQESFFAIEKSARMYQPEKNVKFLTYAGYHLQTQFFTAAKMRSTGWQNDTTLFAISLDEEHEDTEMCLLDYLSDDSAETDIETVIEKDYIEHLRSDLDEAMNALTEHQTNLVKKRYYENIRPVEIARELKVQRASLTKPFNKALEVLRENQKLNQYWLEMNSVQA